MTLDEIHELMAAEISEKSSAIAVTVQSKPHLDAADDDYEFLDVNLDRWGDRKAGVSLKSH